LPKEIAELKTCEKKDFENFKNNRTHDREQSFEIQKQLTEAIDNINEQLATMQKESIEREVADIRWEILKMGTDVSNGKIATREQYDYIARLYDRYEVLLAQLGQENGLITETVKFLQASYQETLRKGIKKA
jgi:Mg2+ and Co2+ transporter CorA